MIDSLFAKTILFLASLFTVLTGTDYVKISSDSLTYDFKTNDRTPIYYFLNTENAGIKKVRFDVTSLSNWVSVSKEGDQPTAKTSLELAQYSPLNFVLEIHPERLPDGANKAKVTVEAVDLQDYSILELKEVIITVNKNLKESLPILSPAPVQTEVVTPIPALTVSPAISPAPTFTVTPKPQIISPSPKIEAPAPSPKISPIAAPEKVRPILNPLQQFIESLRSFIRIFRF